MHSYNCGIKDYDKDNGASQGIPIMKYYNEKNMQSYVYTQTSK
jgi:hypothetical protein